jgi:ABC-type lipoprotein export system ATPase subunit
MRYDSTFGHKIIQIVQRLTKEEQTPVLVSHAKDIAEHANVILYTRDSGTLEKMTIAK